MTGDISHSGDTFKRVPGLSLGDLPGESIFPGRDSGFKESRLLGENLTASEIASAQANNNHKRSEWFRDHFERVAVCSLWVVSGAILIVGVSWFWHMVMPVSCHWLDQNHIEKLQNILTGGVLAAMAGGHMKRRLE